MKNRYVLTTAAILTWMLFFDHNDLVSQVQLRMKLADHHSKLTYYKNAIIEVNKEKQELLTDKAMLEKFAREKYRMKRPDEDLFVIIQPLAKK